jgi:tRNA 2-thiouridine synthesizing protein B
MILHTLNASPSSTAFIDCVNIIAKGDALVLMGDGVYAALADTDASKALQGTDARLYVLTTDALAAGVTNLAAAVSRIDMDGLGALTETFPRQQAWY